jgi:hypothetical protein
MRGPCWGTQTTQANQPTDQHIGRQRTAPAAQVVILAVIPQATTKPNQTALTQSLLNLTCPDHKGP